ncbi:MAG: tRNA (adenosine(37)-N6)-dimethylallyltransferase MiaA [Chloroflexia bacterium]|nr:tRNA (adenosine(37)-N6)-dimethylallyltransferase MiaA [Chloroflexia bacterium]
MVTPRSDPTQPPLIVITGPTGTGKTHAGIELALRFDGEVVSADSRYLYRHFNIGVAKPSEADRHGVPHHVIDVADPNEVLTLAAYQDAAFTAIADIQARNKLPFLVGGTALYLNSVIEGWRIPRVPPDAAFRAEREEEIRQAGIEVLAARLSTVDPIASARSGLNPRRIIRALEIHAATGQRMSELEGKGPPPFSSLEIGLTQPRARRYATLDARIDGHIEAGLVKEVRALLEAGVDPTAPAMSALGYRQLLPYLAGEISLPEAVHRIKIETHRFVRHQYTWLRRNSHLIWLDVSEASWLETASALVTSFQARRPAPPVN